jgi:FtsP/CotA-like multicopper oxidase with cupredoxin domain
MPSRRAVIAELGFAGAAFLGLDPLRRSITAAYAETKTSAPFRVLHARGGATFAGSGEKSPPSSLLGYDGSVPGPLLRARQGDEFRLRLFNELAEPTSVHWHGVRLPNAMDGVPDLTQPAVAPGDSFDYRFTPPDAGTFWYRAQAADQVDRGLYGLLVVEEREAVDVDRDILLILHAPYPAAPDPPEQVRVNGIVKPDIPVQSGERVRLRLLDASGVRGMTLKLDGHAPWIMAIDGQPVDPFRPRDDRVGLAPGGRVDLCLDADASPAARVPILVGTDRAVAYLAYEVSARPPGKRRAEPTALPVNPLPAVIDLKNALRADIAIGDPNSGAVRERSTSGISTAPLFAVKRGRAVSLALRNRTGQPHVVHVHGHHFRLLDRLDDGWKPYWLDTLVIGQEVERIAFVADNPGKWLIESRMLDRGDVTAASWFSVT